MSSKPYDKSSDVSFKKLTKLEQSRESKKRAGEINETLETIGQDSTSKALPALQEKLNHEQKVKDEKIADNLNLLETKTKFSKKNPKNDPYRLSLCELIIARIKEEKWPKDYHFKTLPTDEGVVLLLMTPWKKIFGHGFKPTHLPQYDLNAVEVLVMQAENRVDKLEEARNTTPGGIILPHDL